MVGRALFCTAEVPIKLIEKILHDAASPHNNDKSQRRITEYSFWLATGDWPKADDWRWTITNVDLVVGPGPDDREYPAPTIPPVPESFSSPYIGKSPSELLKIINEEGEGVCWEKFAILDQQTVQDGSVLVCYLDGNEDIEDGLSTVRVHPYIASALMDTLVNQSLDERVGYPVSGSKEVLLRYARKDARLLSPENLADFASLVPAPCITPIAVAPTASL